MEYLREAEPVRGQRQRVLAGIDRVVAPNPSFHTYHGTNSFLIEQAEGLRHNPSLMLIDDADKPAKWYFALKQARLDGSGRHPMAGPEELHWRS